MNRFQRVRSFFTGVVMILASLLLLLTSEENYRLITVFLAVVLIVKGLNALLYYFSMARYAVGGKAALFFAVFLLDFGAFNQYFVCQNDLCILCPLDGLFRFRAVINCECSDLLQWLP